MFAPRPSSVTAPTTPRSPAGTPRSSRRVTSSSLLPTTPSRAFPTHIAPPPLAPLSALPLRPFPTTPYALDPAFGAQRAQDRDALDYAVSVMRDKAAERAKRVAEELVEIEGEQRRVQEACNGLGEAAREMVVAIAREREEVEEMKERDKVVSQAGRALKVQVEAIRADIAEVEAKLEARRALKQKQREAFQHQVSKNAPELAFFEEKLGFKFRGRGRDVVMLKFTNIDPGSYTRTFSFDLDATRPTYAITALTPPSFLPPSVTSPLLASLNASRDLYAFVAAMRSAFKDEVRIEKLQLPNTVDGEREKELERRKGRAAGVVVGR